CLFRSFAGANDTIAIPLGDVDPRLRIFVDLLCSAAGIVSRGSTIVLARPGNSVTLFRLPAGRRNRFLRRKNNGRQSRSQRRGDEDVSFHLNPPLLWSSTKVHSCRFGDTSGKVTQRKCFLYWPRTWSGKT